MMSLITRYWKNRAERAEATLRTVSDALEIAREQLTGIEARVADRAALVSITREGRVNRFLFVRNGKTTMVECYASMEDNTAAWKAALLERITDGN